MSVLITIDIEPFTGHRLPELTITQAKPYVTCLLKRRRMRLKEMTDTFKDSPDVIEAAFEAAGKIVTYFDGKVESHPFDKEPQKTVMKAMDEMIKSTETSQDFRAIRDQCERDYWWASFMSLLMEEHVLRQAEQAEEGS